jgi:flagellar hook protein FlgE
MSLYGLLSTSASGMSAQTSLLSTVSDNISNSGTTGYKDVTSDFSTLVLSGGSGDYQSGGVQSHTVLDIGGQGTIASTSIATNLAVQGTGFFIVQGTNGEPVLTRDGSFSKNSSGELVNSSGYALMGLPPGTTPVSNGLSGLQAINIGTLALKAASTTSGELSVNLPSNLPASSAVLYGNLPSQSGTGNQTTTPTSYTDKTSIVAYDGVGNQVTLDVYFTMQSTVAAGTAAPAGTWDVSVFNAADAATGATAPFPYTSGPLASTTLNFNSSTGAFSTSNPVSPTSIAIPFPSAASTTTMTLDLSKSTQLAASYTVLSSSTNGNAPSAVSGISIGSDGTLSATYQSGSTVPVYTIPLATVTSPDNMTLVSGTAYAPNLTSGQAQVGTAGAAGLGSIQSGSLENSTVDLASQLTVMIEAQNNYQADSKVFQTGSDLLSVLINLKQ